MRVIKTFMRTTVSRSWLAFAMLCAALTPSLIQAAVPSQFIAKQYTEALGRAPDSGGWQAYTNYFNASGCSQSTLSYMTGQIFSAGEYTSKGYTPEEQVLTVYRAVLSREPDQGGFNNWVTQIKNIGMTAAIMAQQFTQSTEFANLIPAICSGNAYRQDWGQTWPININNNLTVWTDGDLQGCINNNTVCSLDPGRLVLMSNPVTIPTGHTLETKGNPDRKMYARQARIVRYNGNFDHLLVAGRTYGNGTNTAIQNVWVNGSGNIYPAIDDNPARVKANIRFESIDANYTGQIQSVRSDFPYQGTHIETGATNNVGGVAVPGTINVNNNLTVGYSSHHSYPNKVYPPYPWADGVSQHIANGTVQGNDIVDPTDVGIVLFGQTGGHVQANTASGNIIVHAGLSAFGSAGLDTTQCDNTTPCQFSGSGISNNTILAGQQQRVDIMLFNGTGPWWSTDKNGVVHHGIGTGGQIHDNNTIVNDALQTITVMQDTVQDVMSNATTTPNQLNFSRQNYGLCYDTPVKKGCINQYY